MVAVMLAAGGMVALPSIIRRYEWVFVAHTCVIPPRNICINNLRELEAAKWQWALEEHKDTNDIPSMAEVSRFMRTTLLCPAGGVYTLGRVDERPGCSLKGHQLP